MKNALQTLTGVSTPEQFETLQFFLSNPDKVWAEHVWHMMRIKKLETEAMKARKPRAARKAEDR